MESKPTYKELEQRVKELEEESVRREQADEALESQKRLMNTLLDNLQVGVFMVEAPTGKPILASKRAINLLGRGILNDVNKNTLAEMYKAYRYGTDEYYPEDQMPIIRGLYGENHYIDDMVVEKPDGSRVLLEVFGSSVMDKQGNVVASLASFADITERKRAAEELKDLNKRLQTILDSIPADIYVADMDTSEIIFMNEQMKESFGRDCTGEICWQAFRDIDAPCKHCTNSELLNENGEPSEVKIWECQNPVNQKWYLNYDRAIPWMEGRYVRIQIATDISVRKQFEKDLQKTRAMLETAINQSPSGILVADAPDVRIRFANPAALAIRGETQKQLTEIDAAEHSIRWQAFYPDGSPYDPQDLPLSKAIFRGEISKDVEIIIRHESGEEHWVSANAAPIRDPNGKIQAGIVVFHDITDRVQAEAALRESEEKFRKLVEESPLGIALIGKDGHYKYTNPQFRNIFGYTIEDVPTGTDWFRRAYPDKVYRHTAISAWIEDQKQIKIGQAIPRVFTVKCKDGSSKEVHFRPVMMENLDQFVIYEDITERKRVEERLQQAQKMESIGRLAGGVAHDLNNLLSPILGYSEMLLDNLDPENGHRESVDEILRAGVRARDLVRQLLAFSRKQTLEYMPLNLNKTIEGFKKLMRRTIREDIEIEVIPASNLRTVKADIGQIEQVIMNLSVNAQDAMPDGGKITLETAMVELDKGYVAGHPGTQTGRYVMLAVSDTGGGMNEATREHIFEPFFSTKGELGTGLGLATVYGIVKQHGGNIWVHSEPEKGTTFKVYLPVTVEVRTEEKPSESATTGLKGSETILLVEDNEQVRNLVHVILKRQGYALLVSENGAEALTVLASHDGPLDLLLTDVIMPDMNGRDLFTRVAEKYRGIRVLYMSGYSDNIIAHQGVLDEGVQFIQKPFTAQGLATKVREVLEQD